MERRYESMPAFIKAVKNRDKEMRELHSGYAHVLASLETDADAKPGCAVFRISEMMENGQGKSQIQDSFCVNVRIE